jgi:hypothetical protein
MKRQRVSASRPLSELQSAVAARLAARTLASGTVTGPCLPSLHGAYVKKLEALFTIMDRVLADERREALSKLLDENLAQGFAATPHARITVGYRPIDGEPPGVHCDIKLEGPSPEELYFAWLAWLGEGAAPEGPDQALLRVVKELGLPPKARALDVGPGARHGQALTALGLRVDAYEPIRTLARELQMLPASRDLTLKVLEQDALDDAAPLPAERYDLIVVADLAPRLSLVELQQALAKLSPTLAAGGKLVFNTFLIEHGIVPTAAERERAQRSFSAYLTDSDVPRLAESSGLKLRTKVLAAASVPTARNASGGAMVAGTAMKSLPLQLERPPGGYARWSTGERRSQADNRALPLRLHWLCLTRE